MMKCAEDLRSLRVGLPRMDTAQTSHHCVLVLGHSCQGEGYVGSGEGQLPGGLTVTTLPSPPHPLTPSHPSQLMATKHESSYEEVKAERDRVQEQYEKNLALTDQRYSALSTSCKDTENSLQRMTGCPHPSFGE